LRKQQHRGDPMKKDWSKYNKSLVNRGSITLWIDESLLKQGCAFDSTKGRPKFKLSIIQAGWILKNVYRLTFRALEGFFSSLLTLLKSDISSPSYSLFCKRGNEVKQALSKLSKCNPTDIVIDASGMKIFGEGEWKTHIHGRDKTRRWIKVHTAVDPKSGECISAVITDDKGGDASQFCELIDGCPEGVKRVYADGAYDTLTCRRKLYDRKIEDIIPPRKTGKLRSEKEMANRNQYLKEIYGLDNDIKLWKKLKRYGTRSLAETFFSRLKTIFGEKLMSRKLVHQELEIFLKLHALNKMCRIS